MFMYSPSCTHFDKKGRKKCVVANSVDHTEIEKTWESLYSHNCNKNIQCVKEVQGSTGPSCCALHHNPQNKNS